MSRLSFASALFFAAPLLILCAGVATVCAAGLGLWLWRGSGRGEGERSAALR